MMWKDETILIPSMSCVMSQIWVQLLEVPVTLEVVTPTLYSVFWSLALFTFRHAFSFRFCLKGKIDWSRLQARVHQPSLSSGLDTWLKRRSQLEANCWQVNGTSLDQNRTTKCFDWSFLKHEPHLVLSVVYIQSTIAILGSNVLAVQNPPLVQATMLAHMCIGREKGEGTEREIK